MKTKRLFLFAGYDANGIIDDAIIYYAEQLNKFGDIILCMDCDAKKIETDKIKNYCLAVIAKRHGEYDFGSYKRAYTFARDNDILKNYDEIYLVNDSVFGPTTDIKKMFNQMESTKYDATGLIISKHRTHSYMESWFVRLNKKIATSKWFNDFITSVAVQPTKNRVTVKYEHGLSNIIKQNNCSWNGMHIIWGRTTYNYPKYLFNRGCPFIKRACFTRHNGAAGRQIKYILNHSNKRAVDAILKTANRIYGTKYMKWLITSNPFKIIMRKLKYARHKIIGDKK